MSRRSPGGEGTPPTAGKEKDAIDDSTPNLGKSKDGPSPRSDSPMGSNIQLGKKKKDDASSSFSPGADHDQVSERTGATGGTVLSGSGVSNITMLTEDQYGKDKPPTPGKDNKGSSPASSTGSKDIKPLRGRKRKAGGAKAASRPKARAPRPKAGRPEGRSSKSAAQTKMNKNFKVIRKQQEKHKRSFYPSILKILRDTQPGKRLSTQAMMIHDSFANDLCDKIIATASQLVMKSSSKMMTSKDIMAAVKLTLPPDMGKDAQKCMEASIASYRELTKKHQDAISKVDKLKASIQAKKKADGDTTPSSPVK